MSKASLKKELIKLTKEQLVEQILDLYDKNKAVKEFYEFYLNPRNEKELAEKYKKLIRKEFNVESPEQAGLKYSVAKRAIADFKDLQPSPEALADVMLTLPECACEFTSRYGDMDEAFYTGAYNNFFEALKFMAKHNILQDFRIRVEDCVKWASSCGYGFADGIADLFYEYY
ncbi:DUF6155 family protein [Parabacteroides sp. FAFU027]|uniref:DUF6155 family protein n=1 Tax=Parabacteroides sp. FAFU027 TaxID=2922715 RepID=UPI001FAF1AF0|nr:DUF6155 family protein [Parabacteroides sp. FAFU027]